MILWCRCSANRTIYKHGQADWENSRRIEEWMKLKKYQSIADFKGKRQKPT
jgi:hypothetical protein